MAELNDVRETVREKYAAAAKSAAGSGDAQTRAGCCGSAVSPAVRPTPAGCLGDRCMTRLPGRTYPKPRSALPWAAEYPRRSLICTRVRRVLDLGSGAGADVLISARRVGPTGKAIGLDMTDEMLELARANAAEAGIENAEFLKGYLEEMPLSDASVDVVISNCVINLSGDKPRVIREAARVLRPGGRFAVSDVIADPEMDSTTRADMAAWTGCVAGALTATEFRSALQSAGFEDVEIHETHRVHEHAAAAIIRARKPV